MVPGNHVVFKRLSVRGDTGYKGRLKTLPADSGRDNHEKLFDISPVADIIIY